MKKVVVEILNIGVYRVNGEQFLPDYENGESSEECKNRAQRYADRLNQIVKNMMYYENINPTRCHYK